MLQLVDVGRRSLAEYQKIVGEEALQELRALAGQLKGARILHLNATPYGGGVSELLRSQVPLLRALGLAADWRVIFGDEKFFTVTKAFHNALQGAAHALTEEDKETYLLYNTRNARLMEKDYDFIVIHDPQAAAVRHLRGDRGAKWVWRCHIDTSQPNPDVWAFLKPFIEAYDAAVFTMGQFIPADLMVKYVSIIPPAIDPLSPKNMDVPPEMCRRIVDWMGIDTERPIITQVSRFDPWKDPLGVIAVYKLAKQEIPGLQLALVGSMALDDPEGWHIYAEIQEYEKGEPDAFVFTNLTGVSNMEVNAFQRHSGVVIQKSIREGFGLVVSETLWKGTPVVAGRAGGIPLQLQDGVSGHLVDSVEECAERVVHLLRHPDEGAAMGAAGRKHVAEHFLLPRLIRDELRLLVSLA
ncbi:MAG: glycosyltransferase [Chloroflexi bacterium]|nr:glycosyltransferase [Chloroflexota bacterium]